jgi:hypothetical protein
MSDRFRVVAFICILKMRITTVCYVATTSLSEIQFFNALAVWKWHIAADRQAKMAAGDMSVRAPLYGLPLDRRNRRRKFKPLILAGVFWLFY